MSAKDHASEGWLGRLFGPPPPQNLAPRPDARVTPDASRCVQCGVCGYNCPVGIPVRDFARAGRPVLEADCVQCGQCILVCPRGTLRWGVPDEPTQPAEPELEALLAECVKEAGA